MLRIANAEEMKQTFRPIDQDEVQFPSEMNFPLLVRDYLAWVEPSGHRTYLVFADPAANKARGIVFRRNHQSADSPATMCDWCHAVRGKGAVGLLTATVSPKNRIGLNLCRDLSCKEKLEKAPGANDVFESIPADDKKRRLVERYERFRSPQFVLRSISRREKPSRPRCARARRRDFAGAQLGTSSRIRYPRLSLK